MYQDIQDGFAYTDQHASTAIGRTYHETINTAHGHLEIRCCWAIADPLAFEASRYHNGWADLHSIVRGYRERRFDNKVERETSYFITSLLNEAPRLLRPIRLHWSIENSLHGF